MPPSASGLQRDLHLLRRRWWLFIPFFFFGVLVAVAFGSFAGQANAVASMQVETVIHELFSGGDRGFRIFEADAMTGDAEFKKKVIEATGDPAFDYARYSISLSPISVADGVSRGVLTVSIQDEDKAAAEKYRQAFVDVFTREYTEPDGLFRRRFIEKKEEVAAEFDKQYQEAIAKLKPLAEAKGLPLEELARPNSVTRNGLLDELNVQEAQLQRELAEVRALPTPDAAQQQRRTQLEGAIKALQAYELSLNPVSFDAEFRALVIEAQSAADLRYESYIRLNNARGAAVSAQSDIETSYSFSGGLSGSLLGRVAIVIAVTLIFGLIAIYTIEWLSQIRSHSQDL
ncbi:MAG: hypothetical protein C0506_05870 [Anaerolinea sp.]|nr:hypothetical protein [Anaerolinea sp.]